MLASIFISKLLIKRCGLLASALIACAQLSSIAHAAPAEKGEGKTYQPEEDDFSSTPFTEYGEFNEESDEEADTKFFQHGRFFGVSIGAGYEGVTGNRGLLWEGGYPLIDLKVHYWFDFNLAMALNIYIASHSFETSAKNGTHVDVNMLHFGLDFKYYFDTKNLSAAVSFANPYLQAGGGAYSKTQSSQIPDNPDSDTGLGVCFGAGLEFAIVPKKTYFEVEARYHMVKFKDTSTALFAEEPNNLPDLSGGFYTVNVNLLFTW